jgi:hypothetical protein
MDFPRRQGQLLLRCESVDWTIDADARNTSLPDAVNPELASNYNPGDGAIVDGVMKRLSYSRAGRGTAFASSARLGDVSTL